MTCLPGITFTTRAIRWPRVACLAIPLVMLALASLTVASLTGCESQTGIVIEVTKGELTESPDALRFFVGVEAPPINIALPGCEGATRYVDDSSAIDDEDEIIDVRERDLKADPYRLLLRPDRELAGDRSLMIAVVALADGRVIGHGALDEPVHFLDGKVLQWTIEPTLRPIGFDPGADRSCLCASQDERGPFVISLGADQDCDGDPAGSDCNDLDAGVHGQATEICGNAIDENCNGQLDEEEDVDGDQFTTCDGDCDDRDPLAFPQSDAEEVCDGRDNGCDGTRVTEPSLCFGLSAGPTGCHIGARTCNDSDPAAGGWSEQCDRFSPSPGFDASPELCAAYTSCAQTGSNEVEQQLACTIEGVFEQREECALFVIASGDQTTLCPRSAAVLGVGEPPGECRWTLLGGDLQGGGFDQDPQYRVTLATRDGQTTGAAVDACEPHLEIVDILGLAQPEPISLFLWRMAAGVENLHLMLDIAAIIPVENAAQCPPEGALQCTNLPIPETGNP